MGRCYGAGRVEDPIEAAWAKLLEEWDDDAAHARFLALASALGCLAEAGRRYRTVRDEDSERSARAFAQIDRLLALAMKGLEATKTEVTPRRGKTTMLLIAIGVSGAIIVTAVALLLRVM